MKTMKHNPSNYLTLEALEPRCLLSGLWTGTDVDGDLINIRLTGPGKLYVTTEDEGLGNLIDSIDLTGTTTASSLTITSTKRKGGDGYVDVLNLDSGGGKFNQVTVDGWLGNMDIGEASKLTLRGVLTLDDQPAEWLVRGTLKNLNVKEDLIHVDMEVTGDLKAVIIEGDLDAATLRVDSQLKQLIVKGDMMHAAIEAGTINTLDVYGGVEQTDITSHNDILCLLVGEDLIDSTILADDYIEEIVVDAGMEDVVIEAGAGIATLDVWDWITDSQITVGADGLHELFAYNLSDTTIAGDVDHVWLDAYSTHEQWDDLVIIIEDEWYWPVYDATYVDVIYVDGGYDYYYDIEYWDVYSDVYVDSCYYDYYYDVYYYDDYGYTAYDYADYGYDYF